MIHNCSNCNNLINKTAAEERKNRSGRFFCNKSCATKYNNKKFPKRAATAKYKCTVCGTLSNRRSRCENHKFPFKIKEYKLNRKLANNLRTRLNAAIKNKAKAGSAVRDLGCSIKELIVYLETKFQPGMSWDNWGRHGWHIDHIRALKKFDLNNKDQFLQACHYTNLQPLWAKLNLKKGAK